MTPSRPVPGQPVTFVLSVRNAGPSAATAVGVIDQVDAAITGVGTATPSGTCTVTGNRVACALGALAPGATATVTVTGTLAPGFTGTLSNTATVDSPTSDPSPADNTSSTTGAASPSADVSITKTMSPTTPVAGDPVSFTLTVRNSGPSVAQAVTVADNLDPALSGGQASSTQGTCTVVDQRVECTVGDVAPGATPVVVTITSSVAPGFTGTLANTGAVAATTPDPNPDNNTATATGGITASADVSVSKSMTPAAPIPGSAISFALVVHNDGPSTATGVVVTDRLVTAISAVTATADDGSACTVAAGNVVSCPLSPLDPGGTDVTVLITGALAPDFAGQLSNTASVSATTSDVDPDDNTATVTGVAAPSADVVLTKSVSPATPVPGQPVTYTVTARNAGPSTALDVVVVDQVSTALTGVVASPTSGSCSVGDTNLVTCTAGSLAPGAATTVTIRGALVPSFTGTLANTASASSATPDPDPDNNRASADAPTAPSADLSVVKRVTPAVPVPGQAITYTLAVHNDGPSTAASVSLVDDLVPDLQGASASTPAGACTVSAGNALECALGALAPGADVAVTVRATLAPDFTGTLANIATVSSPTADPDPDDNDDTVSGDAAPSADVSVTKALGPVIPVPGQEVTFTITVDNAGPSTASGVEVTDALNPALLDVDVQSSAGTCAIDGAGVLTCQLGAVDPDDDPVTITVTSALAADFVGTLSNTARASSPTPDPDAGNNVATVSGDTAPSADVSIAKTLAPGAPVPGESVTYALTVSNAGPSVAAAVTVRDQLDDALSSVTVTPSRGTCDVDDDGLLTCQLGPVAPTDDPVTISVSAVLAADFTDTLSNTATVASPTGDPNPDDNIATVSGITAPSADLAITKTMTPAVPVPGERVTYTLVVTNQGPSTATDVLVTDQLDPRLGDVETDPSAGRCDLDGGRLECALGDLNPGAPPLTVTVSALLAPDAIGDLANTATVASPTPDPDADDNTSTVVGTSAPSADLSVTKTVDPVVPVPGAAVRFTITVDNAGPSTATDVVVTDELDPALGSLSVTASAGTCETVGTDRVLSCDLGSVDVDDDRVVITVAGVLDEDFTGDLTNTAVVSSATPDPGEDDNTATVTAGVRPLADLTVTKTVDSPTVVAGARVDYTITVRNQGPSAALGVVMTDRLPVELRGSVATTDTGTCAAPDADRQLECELGDLSSGAEVVLTVRATVVPGALGTITNTARVTSETEDPDGGAVVATATTEVVPNADVSLSKRASSTTAVQGEVLTYSLRVAARGPSTARDVVVTDRLPAGLSLVGRPSSGRGTCVVRGSVVTCEVGDLAPGDTVTITLRARVDAASGTVVNRAAVSTLRGDRDPSNDVSAAGVRVKEVSEPPPPANPPPPVNPPPPGLSWTGADLEPQLWLAVSLLVAGCVLVLGSRRRHREG